MQKSSNSPFRKKKGEKSHQTPKKNSNKEKDLTYGENSRFPNSGIFSNNSEFQNNFNFNITETNKYLKREQDLSPSPNFSQFQRNNIYNFHSSP